MTASVSGVIKDKYIFMNLIHEKYEKSPVQRGEAIVS